MSSDQVRPAEVVVVCRLDEILVERGMTLTELSRRTGITLANLSVLKTNKAKAVRFTTVAALCSALGVSPGQLFALRGGAPAGTDGERSPAATGSVG